MYTHVLEENVIFDPFLRHVVQSAIWRLFVSFKCVWSVLMMHRKFIFLRNCYNFYNNKSTQKGVKTQFFFGRSLWIMISLEFYNLSENFFLLFSLPSLFLMISQKGLFCILLKRPQWWRHFQGGVSNRKILPERCWSSKVPKVLDLNFKTNFLPQKFLNGALRKFLHITIKQQNNNEIIASPE